MTTSDLDSNASGEKFRKLQRLLSPQEFSHVFRARLRGETKGFVFFSVDRKPPDVGARLGLSVSKKVSSRATRRNRIKRIIRESFRRNYKSLPAKDIIVIAKPECRDMKNEELHLVLQQVWQSFSAS